ncbi:MAG: PDZ domain-containing protein [Planctomycetota bacterium]
MSQQTRFTSKTLPNIMAMLTIAFALTLGLSVSVYAQDDKSSPKQSESGEQEKDDDKEKRSANGNRSFNLPWSSRPKVSKRDPEFIKTFEPVAASMDQATIRIMDQRDQLALGTVIDAAGLILTKASELRPGMECEVNGKRIKPEVVGIHPQSDLALLKIDAKSLNVIQWSDQPLPTLGRWVASPKAMTSTKPAIGIISTAKARVIPPSRPFIGIMMSAAKDGVLITDIIDKSPAKFAGLKTKDIIKEIEGIAVKSNVELAKEIGQFDVGDRVTLTILRGDEKKSIKLTLVERDKVSPESKRSNQQNSMGSELSRRRKDFPKAFQHDSMLNSNTCGGPIVDLSGKVIGINIARDGRVSSLALPVETVLPIIEKLKSGDLSPMRVNKEKIAQLETELSEIVERIGSLPEKKNVLNVRYNRERARIEELDRFAKDYRERVEELEKMMSDYKSKLKEVEDRKSDVNDSAKSIKKDLDSIRTELRRNDKIKSKLEKDLELLKTGGNS